MNLIIDIGNSKCKIAVFSNNVIVDFKIYDTFSDNIDEFYKKYPEIKNCIFSSVGKYPEDLLRNLKNKYTLKIIDNTFHFPFKNKYETPDTLGIDRKILSFGANYFFPNKNNLIIDLGSCVTYDFITKDNVYIGGAISSGIDIRLKSLNLYTQSLPLLKKPENSANMIETSTKKCITSGVLNGLIFEIKGFINYFKTEFEDPNVIITGGDSVFISNILGYDNQSVSIDNFFLLKSLNILADYFNK